MTLVRWLPRRDMLSVQQEMNRLFNNFFGESPAEDVEALWSPRIDVVEDKENYRVRLDLPGIRKEEIKITLRENVLTVSGERTEEAKQDGDTYHVLERRFGKFSRSLTLPSNVDASKIAAKMTDGVLTVTLPKAEEAKPREITIQTN
ncbi:MAG: Hsp20/alpha crystallin family protein [bacterium]|nr:Hsp20/alpha crystallin family protein [bacterium]